MSMDMSAGMSVAVISTVMSEGISEGMSLPISAGGVMSDGMSAVVVPSSFPGS
jgi:hypothetical protein